VRPAAALRNVRREESVFVVRRLLIVPPLFCAGYSNRTGSIVFDGVDRFEYNAR